MIRKDGETTTLYCERCGFRKRFSRILATMESLYVRCYCRKPASR
jgi:hypothetical protein